MTRRLRILTWHVHGSYLRYLSELPHDLYLPVGRDDVPGYGGRGATFDWPDSVHEVPIEHPAPPDIDTPDDLGHSQAHITPGR